MKGDVAVLRAVERKHGSLTAEGLLREAKDAKHPWHDRFTWDDASAAHAYRLDQARAMIRRVRYEVVSERTIYRSSAFVRDPDLDSWEQGYVAVARLRTDKTRAIEALTDEFRRVAAALRRARDIGRTLGLEAEIEQMLVSVEGLAARVAPRRGTSPPPRIAA